MSTLTIARSPPATALQAYAKNVGQAGRSLVAALLAIEPHRSARTSRGRRAGFWFRSGSTTARACCRSWAAAGSQADGRLHWSRDASFSFRDT
jgi:hypothetical protein